VTDRGFDDLAADVDALRQQREERLETVEQVQAEHQQLSNELDDLRDRMPSVDELDGRATIDETRETLQALEADLDDLYEQATDKGFDDLAANVDALHQQREDRLRTVEQKRTQHQQLASEVDDLRSQMPPVDDLDGPDDFNHTRETLSALGSDLDALSERASERGFDDLAADVDALRQQREERLETVEQIQADRQQLDDELDNLRDRIQTTGDPTGRAGLEEARETLQASESDLSDLHERATDRGFDDLAADIDALEEKRADRLEAVERKRTHHQRLGDEVDDLGDRMPSVTDLDSREDIDRARETLQALESDLNDLSERANDHGLDGLVADVDALRQQREDHLETVEQKQADHHQLVDQLNDLRDRVPAIDDLGSREDIDQTRETLQELASDLDDLEERVNDREFDDLAAEIDALRQQREDRLETVEQKRTHYRRLAHELDNLRDRLPSIDDPDGRTNLEETGESLRTLEADLVDLSERANEYGFDDLVADIDALRQQRRDRLETVEQRLRGRPPVSIPHVPDIAVDYDALTEEELIGSGGSADVVRATLPTSDDDVTLAIKKPRMSGTLHSEQVDRLLSEAETWDKLDDHDHIVGVVDYGSEPLPWIAMEYMDAGHLGERASEMDIDQALWTAISITRGVRHAHRRGIAHLDLKPHNVLFRTVDDAWDVPKVADWGLSKHLLEHSKSIDGMTVEYAAPEQFDDSRGASDDITDIYQLGVVFYELFTGHPPFEGQPFEIIERLKNDQPTPPSELADVPPALDEVLLTALAKEKTDRYDNVAYLRDALEEILNNGYNV